MLWLTLSLFTISMFLASLASHVEDQRIKRSIEIIPKVGFARIVNILSRWPALIALIVFHILVFHIAPLVFFGIFGLCYVACGFLLKRKKMKEFLLANQIYVDTASVVLVIFVILFPQIGLE